jgi:hypothetical protein
LYCFGRADRSLF